MANFPEREQEFQDALDQTSDQDTFIFDTSGTRINPLDQGVTESVDSDYVRTTIFGVDSAGDFVQISVNSGGELDVTLEGDTIGINDSADNRIDPLDEDVTDSVGTDELRSLTFGEDNAGAAQVVTAEQLATGVSSNRAGLLTYSAGALESIGVDEVRQKVQDRQAQAVTLASSTDITSGTSTSLQDNDSFTLYVDNEGSVNTELEIQLSPDGGTNQFSIEENPVRLKQDGDPLGERVIKLSYDTDHIEVNTADSTLVTAIIREVV